MKIGKTKYLSLLDMSSSFDEERTLIIEPLTKVYKEIWENTQYRIIENQNEINLTKDEVVDDETGKTSHELLDGMMEDISFEYQLQTTAIAIRIFTVMTVVSALKSNILIGSIQLMQYILMIYVGFLLARNSEVKKHFKKN